MDTSAGLGEIKRECKKRGSTIDRTKKNAKIMLSFFSQDFFICEHSS